jgi:Arc/MetJ-type ribon-helix-helix transcriptional regulator
MPERKRKTVSIRLDLLGWMHDQIAKGRFHNFSHAIEIALENLRSEERKRR